MDSLTGWAVSNKTNQNPDTMYVLKTTNSGDSWIIQHSRIQTGGGFSGYFKVYFLDQDTGYTCDVRGIYKSTDGGMNWVSLNAPLTAYTDMTVLNTDTIWIVTADSFSGGVFRTTNGGVSWDNQLNLGSQNPDHIYFYDARIGYIGKYGGSYLRKTTNSGINWFIVDSGGFNGFNDMYFVDSLTGWRAVSFMKKTTDGGYTWSTQTLPSGGIILSSGIFEFSKFSKNTIFGVGGEVFYGAGQFRGIIYRTTNGGDSWSFQVPDTAIHSAAYRYIHFLNNRIGWAYWLSGGVHTINGGDITWLTDIEQISSSVPKEYLLYQNYPNPFNPVTNIRYSVKRETSNVKLVVYDIQGKFITELVNQKQTAGTYEVDFTGTGLSSGVYFYRLTVTSGKEVFTETKRMSIIK